MTHIRSRVISAGHYLPERVMTNDDLSKIVDTNDEWITDRTGIKERHIIADDQFTSDLCVNAANMALEKANLTGADIDLVIVATITPDNTTPAVSTKVSHAIGLTSGKPAFDISAACSGFVYAMTMADNMIRLGQIKRAVIIGAESLSRITDWTDRNTCVLFGDGAGAVVLEAAEGTGKNSDRGVLATKIYADGGDYDALKTLGGTSTTQNAGNLYMNGKEVFRAAVPAIAQGALDVLEECGMSVDDIDYFIPHQANIRIIDAVAKRINLPEGKAIVTVDHCGNTSAASIPIALSETMNAGKFSEGDLIVISAMGAGFTWGAAAIRL